MGGTGEVLREDCKSSDDDGAEDVWRGGMGLSRWKDITSDLRGMRVGLEGVSGDFSFLEKENASK